MLVHFRRIEDLKDAALDYQSVELNSRQLCDLELLLNRAFYPLTGYLNQEDYESVLDTMRLADGTVWPMPICLDVNEKTAQTLDSGQPLALRDEEGFLLGSPDQSKIFGNQTREEKLELYLEQMIPKNTQA